MGISSDAIRGYVDIIILGLLIEKEMYGYEITKEVLKRCENLYELNEATMYSGLKRLEKSNLIRAYDLDNSLRGGKRRYYQITIEGKAHYKDKCEEWGYIKRIVNHFIKEDL